MANTYKATSAYGQAIYGEDVVELDLTATEEQDLVPAHLELVPRAYSVLSTNFAAGAQGSTVELALAVELEAALIEGGHIERADSPPSKPRRRRGSNPEEKE